MNMPPMASSPAPASGDAVVREVELHDVRASAEELREVRGASVSDAVAEELQGGIRRLEKV